MNELLNTDNIEVKTISSVELSKISWRRHDVLLKSIERMNQDLISIGKPPAVDSSYISQQ